MLESIPRLNNLGQSFAQRPILYKLNSDTEFISPGWKTTKELIKKGRWKWLLFTMDNLVAIF